MTTRAGQLCVIAALILGGAAPARGQAAPAAQPPAQSQPAGNLSAFPTWEVSGGYQLLHQEDQTFPFGLNLDGAWNFSSQLGAVGEIGWAMDSEDLGEDVDVSLHAWNIGVGPRWNGRNAGRVWPFAQVLVGALYARSSTEAAGVDLSVSDTRFMLQPGVGVNVIAGDGWGIVGQVDYRRVFTDEDETGESGINQFRVFIGGRLLLD
jgi:hypothetical protein